MICPTLHPGVPALPALPGGVSAAVARAQAAASGGGGGLFDRAPPLLRSSFGGGPPPQLPAALGGGGGGGGGGGRDRAARTSNAGSFISLQVRPRFDGAPQALLAHLPGPARSGQKCMPPSSRSRPEATHGLLLLMWRAAEHASLPPAVRLCAASAFTALQDTRGSQSGPAMPPTPSAAPPPLPSHISPNRPRPSGSVALSGSTAAAAGVAPGLARTYCRCRTRHACSLHAAAGRLASGAHGPSL
jgi:hypothetical protein